MSELSLMVTVAELSRRTQRSKPTIRRYLKRKHIVLQGHSIMLIDLRTRWPAMYNSLVLAIQGPPPCPACGVPTECECPACGMLIT